MSPIFQHVNRQNNTQRNNLVHVCRLSIKSLIDKSCFEVIDDKSEELLNFAVILEHILSHRLKSGVTWYGSEERKTFWQFIKATCRKLPGSSIAKIESLTGLRSPLAKGRAWIRLALMEKKLAAYLSEALKQEKLLRNYYEDQAVMLTEDASVITGMLVSLNAIDFSFCLKEDDLQDLGIGHYNVIDYTPYLQFQMSSLGHFNDTLELATIGGGSRSNRDNSPPLPPDGIQDAGEHGCDDSELDTWKSCYQKLLEKYRTLCKQKSYLEELMHVRDRQLQAVSDQHCSVASALSLREREMWRDREQLEEVILELQQQLSDRRNLEEYLIMQCKGNMDADILETLSMHRLRHISDGQMSRGSRRTLDACSTELTASGEVEAVLPSGGPTLARQRSSQLDTHSLRSSHSTVSTCSYARGVKEDTVSLIPMTGSLTSQQSAELGLSTDIQVAVEAIPSLFTNYKGDVNRPDSPVHIVVSHEVAPEVACASHFPDSVSLQQWEEERHTDACGAHQLPRMRGSADVAPSRLPRSTGDSLPTDASLRHHLEDADGGADISPGQEERSAAGRCMPPAQEKPNDRASISVALSSDVVATAISHDGDEYRKETPSQADEYRTETPSQADEHVTETPSQADEHVTETPSQANAHVQKHLTSRWKHAD
ncbi:PREDICTED: RUN domain-containing protein 3B-like [Priapulus caudatus]|uniref:RUN domain-containing protein 3B-like n=1 Tax=Priapulus caudatus TaxID=37621 RepID=A0ABM1E3F9_PRICU|nr:PREDICTED: RUN domain-containing protein 3B-like [Priapulus caudatus]